MTRRRALVVCPGRGTYNREELGYLGRHHSGKHDFIGMVDGYRARNGMPTVSALDMAAHFSSALHGRGDNASPLIYACAYADFLDIDRERFEIVAVTGNSMGWYIALACAGAVTPAAGLTIVDTMGTLMHGHGIGGQLIYPVVDENWVEAPGRRSELLSLMREVDEQPGRTVRVSIDLGGMLVFAGDEAGLRSLADVLPPAQGRYPMRLQHHAAFHSPLQASVAAEGQAALTVELFGSPDNPLIDGRGHMWHPHETRPDELRAYTLGAQVTEPYDFTRAIVAGVREFAPDVLIVLGPGKTLGAAIAQTLIAERWRGFSSKATFQALQKADPLLLAMAIEEQRRLVAA